MPKVKAHLQELEELCRRHGVARLDIFGSSRDRAYHRRDHDLDFLVQFKPMDPEAHAQAYLGLLGDLQDLFDCRIDLVEEGAISNPYFREGVEGSRRKLYEA